MNLTYTLYEAGFCTHCQRMTLLSGQFKSVEYPALCALIYHPSYGYILFDTGYTERFNALTQTFPKSLYRKLTPAFLSKPLSLQLVEDGIHPDSINYIVLSHFHADHIGGLRDFPNAQFICHPEAIEHIKNKKGFKALLSGFLPELLPVDFYDRLILLQDEVLLDNSMRPFIKGFSVLGDEHLLAISLPGHAKGQVGLYFKAQREVFLIADSCWHQETFQSLIFPSALTYLLHDNRSAYIKTIHQLHELYKKNPTIDLIPSHCQHIRGRLHQGRPC
ncbi:MBL fold metallo-hydrolase [Legionella impletisoli]|uniref:Zn-dependent hydrolase n=1 Tax=Legionella impletisoli TaxID=343510 RepID=A0A917JRT1_9GAMM|nr:MBL fold metallo-hydrolase [Legionella impletisoli]GGI82319.1 Zn-dependent hydrolase [Legionella impletisoli]